MTNIIDVILREKSSEIVFRGKGVSIGNPYEVTVTPSLNNFQLRVLRINYSGSHIPKETQSSLKNIKDLLKFCETYICSIDMIKELENRNSFIIEVPNEYQIYLRTSPD